MLNNFIYAQAKGSFLKALNDNQILDEAIVFIEDTGEIWNHGHYFGSIMSTNDIEDLLNVIFNSGYYGSAYGASIIGEFEQDEE